MSLRTLAAAWNRALFTPQAPEPLALFRILFGLLVCAKLILLWPDWLNWFGVHGMVTLETMHKMEPGLRIDLFDALPQNDFAILLFFWVALAAALCVALGCLTTLSTLAVFLALVSLDERGLYLMNAGDSFLRVSAFFLLFAPTNSAFSLDRLLRIWRGKESPAHRPQIVWAQRMLQFLVALVYFATAWWKSTGTTWVDGSAVYYVHHLDEFRRFPLPGWVDNPLLVKLQTWFGLVTEYSLATLIWIKEFRYWVLAAGVALHLALEYSMNVPLFQWIMLSSYVLFVDPEDLKRVWTWLSGRIAPWLGSPVVLTYSSRFPAATRTANLVRALDIFRKVDFRDAVLDSAPGWAVESAAGNLQGWPARRELARVIPVLFPLRIVPARR